MSTYHNPDLLCVPSCMPINRKKTQLKKKKKNFSFSIQFVLPLSEEGESQYMLPIRHVNQTVLHYRTP